jgi:hypothetical protein
VIWVIAVGLRLARLSCVCVCACAGVSNLLRHGHKLQAFVREVRELASGAGPEAGDEAALRELRRLPALRQELAELREFAARWCARARPPVSRRRGGGGSLAEPSPAQRLSAAAGARCRPPALSLPPSHSHPPTG